MKKHMLLNLIVVVMAILGQSSRARAAEYVIDLSPYFAQTGVGAVPLSNQLRPSPGITSDSASPIESGFSIVSTWTDKSAYHDGDDILFEVTLRYDGAEPFTLPTVGDPTQFSVSMTNPKAIVVSMNADDQTLGAIYFGYQEAFSADEISGSSIVVQTGDTVRLRISGSIYVKGVFAGAPQRSVSPAVTVYFYYYSPKLLPVSAVSSTAIQVGP